MRKFLSYQKYFRIILWGVFFVTCLLVNGQENNRNYRNANKNYITPDNNFAIDTSKKEHKHSPGIAWISSALFPGLGQIYNEKNWKAPIIWGAGMGMYFYVDLSNQLYHHYKLAWENCIDERPITDPILANRSEAWLKHKKDYWRRNRDLAAIISGALYIVNILDAMVDAYFFNFDVSRDLSLHWSPAFLLSIGTGQTYASSAIGLNIQLRFR